MADTKQAVERAKAVIEASEQLDLSRVWLEEAHRHSRWTVSVVTNQGGGSGGSGEAGRLSFLFLNTEDTREVLELLRNRFALRLADLTAEA